MAIIKSLQRKTPSPEKPQRVTLSRIFIEGFEDGVRYGLAAHLMEPNYNYKQIMNYAKNWFVYNQIADSTDFIQLPVIGKNHIILFKANKKVK